MTKGRFHALRTSRRPEHDCPTRARPFVTGNSPEASRARSGLRVAVIASSRFPIAEPFAGGLESHVWQLASALKARGHQVSMFAAPGSDPALCAEELPLRSLALSSLARSDVAMTAGLGMDEHHAYLSLMMRLGQRGQQEFDVVHNHSLHYLPIAMAPLLSVPMISTLHTPPTPWLESAMQVGDRSPVRFVAVSDFTARSWRHVAGPVPVITNGIDCNRWPAGPGGRGLVWSGRIVPEKGLHLAVEAARLAGRPLSIAGPVVDRRYFTTEILPFLDDRITYAGHLDHLRLSALVRTSSAALVTPTWDEPYGLVVAEALSSGTPVVAFARGGIPEILDDTCGRLVPAGDVRAMAAAIPVVERLPRQDVRTRAETHCSASVMVDAYERMYGSCLAAAA